MDVSSTKCEEASETKSKQTNVSRPRASHYYCDRVCKIVKLSDRRKKKCEDIFLGFATVIALCISALPAIVFFTIEVRTQPLVMIRALHGHAVS